MLRLFRIIFPVALLMMDAVLSRRVLFKIKGGCGVTRVNERIVGGQAATNNQFPWFARIHIASSWCGACLITSRHLISTAHCAYEANTYSRIPDFIQLCRVGFSNKTDKRTFKFFPVANIIIHADFDPYSLANDIMVIEMIQDIESWLARPVCLVSFGDAKKNWIAFDGIVVGFGSTDPSNSKNSATYLQMTVLKLLSKRQCVKEPFLTKYSFDFGKQICASLGRLATGITSTCHGDSGGPFTISRLFNGVVRNFVVGLLSYGQQCSKGTPAVLVRISAYLDFIRTSVVVMDGSMFLPVEHRPTV